MAATLTTLTASRNRVVLGGSVTFCARVTGADPAGTVCFLDGAALLGTGEVGASGMATFTTAWLPVGCQAITAAYGGDGRNDPSTSPPITVEVVNPLPRVQRIGSGSGFTGPNAFSRNSEFEAIRLAAGTSVTPLSTLSTRRLPVAASQASGVPVDLVFISPEIVAAVPPDELAGARVFILDAGHDVIDQVGSALQANPGASVVRLISHGEAGGLILAGQRLTRDTLQLRSDDIAGWRQYLAPGADILLYGCSVAATPEGRSFVDFIATLSGADVAASSNPTGAAVLGGDLTLEYASGPIEALSGLSPAAWDQSGLILGAPVFSSSASADFTSAVSGSFAAAASGSPTYSIADHTFVDCSFASLPADWTVTGAAALSGGELVLNPAANSKSGILLLPKLGADSPGSFTATFDYATDLQGGNGTSFNYGIIKPPTLPDQYHMGLVATGANNGLSVNLIDLSASPRIDVTWGGSGSSQVVASAPITFANTPKPVEIKLDGANILTVRYDGVEKLRMNMAGKVNAADRSNWQFALGSSTAATVKSSHAIDNLKIVSNGALPAGLTLNPSTGVISGTPTTANNPGVQTFDLVATNADGATAQLFNLGLASGAPVFTSDASNPMLPGVAETFTVAATGAAGPTTYSVGPTTIINTTLADFNTLPAGAYITGSAAFDGGDLDLTQNLPSQTGRLQFLGQGKQNPSSFSASFNYKVGGTATSVGGDNLTFYYGGPGVTGNPGISFQIKEYAASTGGGNNTNLTLSLKSNNNDVTNAVNIAFPNPYLPAASGYNYLPIRLNMSDEGRLQVYINNVLALDAGNVSSWQTVDKSLWAFGLAGSTSATSNNFHSVKDLVITTNNGVLPPGLTFNTSTGQISGALPVGTSVDSYVPIIATNAAGTSLQSLKLDVSASNLLPGQRPGNGASVGSPSTGGGNALGVTGYQFRNLTAFAALKADGQIVAWGDSNNGGKGAPTGSGYTVIVSSEKAFAALKNDGSIVAWGNSANGATGAPSGTGYQRIAASRNAFAALRSDGGITVWGATNGGGLPFSTTAAPAGIIYPPTTTGFIRLFANGGGFSAQRVDGTIVSWGNSTTTNGNNSVTPNAPSSTATFGNRVVPNDYAATTPTTGTTASIGAFAGVSPIPPGTNPTKNITTWGSSLTGYANDAPGSKGLTGVVDIVATSRAFAEIDYNGQIISWGDSNFGGASGANSLAPKESGYKQIYANSGAFVAVRQDGSLTAWGSSNNGGTGAPTGTGYTQVFSTLNAFAALKADGSISVWGNTGFGGNPTA
ncbi:MAG: hypothetical protein RLZZ611_2566, partial [Cyanobacteriota bacterium]